MMTDASPKGRRSAPPKLAQARGAAPQATFPRIEQSEGVVKQCASFKNAFLLVRIGAPRVKATALESQLIHLIQELSGRTLTEELRDSLPAAADHQGRRCALRFMG
jgi:hypothetical protein